MPDLRFQSQPARHTEIPRPKRAEGQWSLGYTEPLNKNEQSKKDDDPLNVRARILQHLLQARLRLDRPRRPARPVPLDGPLHPAQARHRRRQDRDARGGGARRPLLHDAGPLRRPAALRRRPCARSARIGVDFARDTADVTDRENIQYHWIRIEDVPEIWDRLDAAGLSSLEACGDSPRPFLGSPVAGVAKDEIIDGSSALEEIFAPLHRRPARSPTCRASSRPR